VTEQKLFVFSFGDFTVSEHEFLLVKATEAVPVEPKAFRVLLFLLRNPGRLVGKDEILNAVWSDCSVSDNSLTRSIATLRRLLGDDSREPQYIATVQTIGYRFLCEVRLTEAGSTGLETAEQPHTQAREAATTISQEEKTQESSDVQKGRRWLPRVAIVGAAVLILIAAGFLLRRAVRRPDAQAQPAIATRLSQRHGFPITSLLGNVWDPALSPNGDQIAFMWDGENPPRNDLYVQMVGGEKPLQLTHTHSGFMCCADWSPDGTQLAFGRCDDNGGGVFVIPALGGAERKLTEVTCTFWAAGLPKWTADGNSMLLADRCKPDGPRGIVVFSLATGEKRCLTAPPPHGDVGDTSPILSPDGKTVAFLRFTTLEHDEIYTIDLSGNNLRQLTHDDYAIGDRPMWAADGKYVLFYSNRGGEYRLWRVSVRGGAIEPETVYPAAGTLSRDGKRLAYSDGSGSSSIWRARLLIPGGKVLSLQKVLASGSDDGSPQLSSDGGQIVFQSARSGQSEIWTSDSNGNNPFKLTLTTRGLAGTPRWSPDGKWIAFDWRPEQHCQIYAVDVEGRNLHSVTSGDFENDVPSWSRDGASIYFSSNRTGDWQVWRRELSSGKDTQITRNGGLAAFESYDVKTLYYSKFDRPGVWATPVDGGNEKLISGALHLGYWGGFAVTAGGIYLLDADAIPRPTIMYYDFQTQRVSPVIKLEQSPATWHSSLAASRDGKTVMFTQSLGQSHITMVENFQ